MQATDETDARISRFKLEFPVRTAAGAGGLEPTQTYYGRVVMHTAAAVRLGQVHVELEGWERVDVGAGGAAGGAARRSLLHATAQLLEGARTVSGRAEFEFACTMPNVNFPAAMRSAICEIAYTARAWASSAGGRGRRLAADTVCVQVAPRVVPAGVGWLKPLVLRDGIEVAGAVRRRLRRPVAAPAMTICVRVRNHCCTLGEAIAVDVDAAMLQRDRVLASVRAAVVEQVALKPRAAGGAPTVLAERTLNRKAVAAPPAGPGLAGVQDMHIRVPRRDVCTADGAALSFAHVLRLTFELASVTGGAGDARVATKDVPLRLVTSKFGDVGRASQAEINRRLSALTAESDGGAVSEAYGYLLGESGRAARPASLDALLAAAGSVPQPMLVALPRPAERPSPPLSVRSCAQDSCVVPPTPAPHAFQFGPLPPLPQPASSPADNNDDDNDDDDGAFCFAPQIAQCGSRIRDTLVDNALGVSLPTTNNSTTSSPFLLPPLPPKQQQPLPKQQQPKPPQQPDR
ncbi:hypothetical protein GGF42_004730, partial [Coemansia sp. RSA 2424]